jgi:hypothetical protein
MDAKFKSIIQENIGKIDAKLLAKNLTNTQPLGIIKSNIVGFAHLLKDIEKLLSEKKAIADNTPNIGASGAGKTALRTNTKIIKESNQGFSRTPTRWKATAQSKSEGRR